MSLYTHPSRNFFWIWLFFLIWFFFIWLSINLPICNTSSEKWLISLFWFFFVWIFSWSHKVIKCETPSFEKKVLTGQKATINPKNGLKMRFTDIYPFINTFFFNMKVLMVVKLSAKTSWLGRIWFFGYGAKTSRPIRIQNLQYATSNLSYKFEFLYVIRHP